MELNVTVHGNRICVACSIPVSGGDYRFALTDSLTITWAENNGKKLLPALTEACEMEFRPAMTKYTFPNVEAGRICFAYEGTLQGWYLLMGEDIYHFSLYNGWYPMGFDTTGINTMGIDVREDYHVTINVGSEYRLINGSFDEKAGVWRYHGQAEDGIADCNIILMREGSYFCCENDWLSVICFDAEYEKLAQACLEDYALISQFYIRLYGLDRCGHTSVVILPKGCGGGAYKRRNLIVFGEVFEEKDMSHILAHETGHAYASGADTESWEDWLNETHAEWGALLYALEYQPEYFHQIMEKRLARRGEKELCLKEAGEGRPANVHTTGTLIYYGIYKKYGVDSIKLLLRTFDTLTPKDTASFLRALRGKGAACLAEEIEAHLS